MTSAFCQPVSHLSRIARTLLTILLMLGFCTYTAAQEPEEFDTYIEPAEGPFLDIVEPNDDRPIQFATEVLPLLRKSCIACHNSSNKQSDLNLETPEAIKKGGYRGPALYAGRSDQSLVLQVAAHRAEPIMPPKENEVGARNLSPQDLGLLKRWIDQGAKGSVSAQAARIDWQPLPPGLNAILALDVTPRGDYLAAGRANQIFIYHLPTRSLVTRLTDPAMQTAQNPRPGIAHLDFVQSLAFDPQGERLASGGYRNVKLWKKQAPQPAIVWEFPPTTERPAALSPAGTQVAWVTESQSIELRDATDPEQRREISLPEQPLSALFFSYEGHLLAGIGTEQQAFLWDIPTGELLQTLPTTAKPTAFAWSKDGDYLSLGDATGQVTVWQKIPSRNASEEPDSAASSTWREVRSWKAHPQAVRQLVYLPENKTQFLSLGENEKVAKLWNRNEEQPLQTYSSGSKSTSVAIDPSAKTIALGDEQGTTTLFELRSGKKLGTVSGDGRFQQKLSDLRFQQRLLSQKIKQLERAKQATVKQLAESKQSLEENQKKLATAETKLAEETKKITPLQEASETEIAAVAKLNESIAQVKEGLQETEQRLKATIQEVRSTRTIADEAAKSAKAQPENQALLRAYESAQQAAQAAKMNTDLIEEDLEKLKQQLAEANKQLPAATKKQQQASKALEEASKTFQTAQREVKTLQREVELSQEMIEQRDGKGSEIEASLAAFRASLEAINAKIAKVESEAQANQQPLAATVLAKDGQLLLTLDVAGLLQSWSLPEGNLLETYSLPEGTMTAVTIDASGKIMGLSPDGRVARWEVFPEWKLEQTVGSPQGESPFAHRVLALDFNPEGTLLATGGGEPSRSGEIILFDAETGSRQLSIADPHTDTVFDLEFSPFGTRLASGSADKFAKVFDLATGEKLLSLEGHTHHVLGIAWQQDGTMLATAGADNEIKIWDTETGAQTRTIKVPENQVTGITYLNGSENIVVSSDDTTIRFIQTNNGRNYQNYRVLRNRQDYLNAIAATREGNQIVTGGQSSILYFFDAESGRLLSNFPPPADPPEVE
ncbi:Hypothetical protein PBC10988_29880 [Planctomycetales bacterium 10988]|nr:Hypothetical protein PBC10988_29880 [Planctomycetales bacterium 10988]